MDKHDNKICNQLERENESGARNEIQREKLIWSRSEHNKSNRYGMTITELIRLLENELDRLSCSRLDMRDWFIKGRKLQRLRLQTFIQQTINEIKVAKWSFKADYSILPQETIYPEKYKKLTNIDLDYLAPQRLECEIYLDDVNTLQADDALEMQNGHKLEGGFIEYNKVEGRWELTARKENGEKYQDVQEYCFDTYFDKGVAGSFNKWFLDDHIRGALADDIRRCRLIREGQIRAWKEHELALQRESDNRILLTIQRIGKRHVAMKHPRLRRNLQRLLSDISVLMDDLVSPQNKDIASDLVVAPIKAEYNMIEANARERWALRAEARQRKILCFGKDRKKLTEVMDGWEGKSDLVCFYRIEPARRAHVRRQDHGERWWTEFFKREIETIDFVLEWRQVVLDAAVEVTRTEEDVAQAKKDCHRDYINAMERAGSYEEVSRLEDLQMECEIELEEWRDHYDGDTGCEDWVSAQRSYEGYRHFI